MHTTHGCTNSQAPEVRPEDSRGRSLLGRNPRFAYPPIRNRRAVARENIDSTHGITTWPIVGECVALQQKWKETDMGKTKTREEALASLKKAIQHKQEWKKEIEQEYAKKGEQVKVVFL